MPTAKQLANLKPYQTREDLSDDEKFDRATAAGVAAGVSKRRRKTFKELFVNHFDEIAENGKSHAENVVAQFVNLLESDKISVKDRIALFEIILKCIGELGDEKLTANQIRELASVIELKIQ